MDIALYSRVVRRFRKVVLTGLIVAILLTFLMLFSVSGSGIRWRDSQKWISYAQVFVTQRGFPWGRLGLTDADIARAPRLKGTSSQVADPGRLTNLAVIYSHLITTDGVRALMPVKPHIAGTVEAAPLLALNGTASPLPIISIAAHSDSPSNAIALAGRATTALRRYIELEQSVNRIPPKDRVDLPVILAAAHAKVEKGRSYALAIVVFLSVMLATFAIAMVLENLNPEQHLSIAKEAA